MGGRAALGHSWAIREGVSSCTHRDITEQKGRCVIISRNKGNIYK